MSTSKASPPPLNCSALVSDTVDGSIRMLVAQALRSFHGLDNGKTTSAPKFKRKQAEDWLFYEDQIIQRVNSLMHQLSGPAGHQLTRRPYRINWFINQLAMCASFFALLLALGADRECGW